MDILQACDLKKTYGTGEACVHALDGVSLNVGKGEFVAIVAQAAVANPPSYICWVVWTDQAPAKYSWMAKISFP